MAEAIRTEAVTFPSNGEAIRGHLARPVAPGPHPAVVVIQEIWGLNDHIRDVAERFAREGYVGLAPDMYSREGGAPSQEIEALRSFVAGIPDRRVIQDLRAAAAYLRTRREVRGERIGAIGFCMGGAWALLLACHEPIQACADFYGRVRYPELSEAKPRHPIDCVPSLACPLLGIFAGDDPVIPVPWVRDLEEALRAHGKSAEVHVYPGVPHAFFNDQRDSYRPAAAKDAWAKTLAFFGRHLKGA